MKTKKNATRQKEFTVLSMTRKQYKATVRAKDAREAAMKAQLYPEEFKWKTAEETPKHVLEVDGEWVRNLSRSA